MNSQFKNSKTPYSAQFDDVYFSEHDGIAESEYVYLDGVQLNDLIESASANFNRVTLGEMGFGVGLNFVLTLKRFFENSSPNTWLTYLSFEKFPVTKEFLKQLYSEYPSLEPYTSALIKLYPVLTPGIHCVAFPEFRTRLILGVGDAKDLLPELNPGTNERVQAWYWDGFAPAKNPDAFNETIFLEMARLSAPHARGASFTSAGWVRRNLEQAGFAVTKRKGYGKKRECLIAELKEVPQFKDSQPWFSLQNVNVLKPGQNVAVVGARLSGTAIAQSLMQRGFQVTLIDQSATTPGHKSNLAGLFNTQLSRTPNPISRFAQRSLTHFLRELNFHSIPTQLGVFRAQGPDSILPQLESSGYPQSFFKSTELYGKEGVLFPELGIINPKELCESRAKGAEFIHAKVTDLDPSILKSFDHVIYAGGADLGTNTGLLEHCVLTTPLRPIRGQVIHCKPTATSKTLEHTLVDEGYVTPIAPNITHSHEHLVGSTYLAKPVLPEQEEMQIETDTNQLLQDLSSKWNMFNAISRENVAGYRVGYRMSTPDKLPMIGPAFEDAWLREHYLSALKGGKNRDLPALQCAPNSWYFFGMGSRGIIYSSLGASVLTSMMLGEIVPIERSLLEHLFSTRFAVRNIRKQDREQ